MFFPTNDKFHVLSKVIIEMLYKKNQNYNLKSAGDTLHIFFIVHIHIHTRKEANVLKF